MTTTMTTMTMEQLGATFEQTLSPIADVRKTAEKQLELAQRSPGHAILVLQLVASGNTSPQGNDALALKLRAVCQAAAVHFKNLVRKAWDAASQQEHDDTGITFSPSDREKIQSHLVELMCTTPAVVQSQLSEAIALISNADYPDRWPTLLPELVRRMTDSSAAAAAPATDTSTTFDVLNGVLHTANAIFKSFRYKARSDDLFRKILYSLQLMQEPLLRLFQSMSVGVEAAVKAGNLAETKARLHALRTMNRIFFSLIWHDLPEYYEDHMADVMQVFGYFLDRQRIPAALDDADEEDEPTEWDRVQVAIVQNLFHYANKDEESFEPFLPNFCQMIWTLLMALTPLPKHDQLAMQCIRFLSLLVSRTMHKELFQGPETLPQFIGNIVIPNLRIRQVDEERFEDDPQEFLATDLEKTESESRRRCAQDLLKNMCRVFDEQTTTIAQQHISTMLNEYRANPTAHWQAKDVAIHLMLGIAIRAESFRGVSRTSSAVNVMDFFSSHIFPELQDKDIAARPMLKTTSIKFVCTFRNQFSKDDLILLMPVIIGHLPSDIVVVHTYAAYTIERLLTTRQSPDSPLPKLAKVDLQPFLEPLFTGLFRIIDNEAWNENERVMKCCMRVLSVSDTDFLPVTEPLLARLTGALGRAAKNPRNPHYNHCLFESIAILIRTACGNDPTTTTAFEELLFPPFQAILQMDVSEFTPYVFQLLAQLLEFRPMEAGLGNAYTSLFPPLLTPTIWLHKGNVPALTRLLGAYLLRAAREVTDRIDAILGVFQKLVSVSATEVSAMDLLQSITRHVPRDVLSSRIGTVFRVLLTRLQVKGTFRYKQLLTQYFALYTGLFGGTAFLDVVNSVQAGLGLKLMHQVWLPRLQTDAPTRQSDARIQIVGLSIFLKDSPALPQGEAGRLIWSAIVTAIVSMLDPKNSNADTWAASSAINDGQDDAFAEIEISADSAMSLLCFAQRPVDDPFANLTSNPALFFGQTLVEMSRSAPGQFPSLIQQLLDPKIGAALNTLLQQLSLALA